MDNILNLEETEEHLEAFIGCHKLTRELRQLLISAQYYIQLYRELMEEPDV